MMLATAFPLTQPAAVFAVLFALVLVLPRVAEAIRLPGLIGLIAGGVLIGPNGLGMIERAGTVALLGGAGLLYLMFEAGLELDTEDLRSNRRSALLFGALTFVLPFALGSVVHTLLGYSVLASLLLASCWSSHTLLAYPAFQRARVITNRAVAVGIGGTIITDTAALLVLVALASAHSGDLTLGFALVLVPKLLGACFVVLVLLPKVADWFFAGIGQDRSARFLFVVAALFASAELAELAGVEAIIGAFMAGLALNRRVTDGSPLAGEIQFFGANFMVPLFLISVGMLVDPAAAFSDPATLRDAAAFAFIVVAGKLGAAAITGRVSRYTRYEVLALFSLSVAQAAATLAAVFVGIEIGLLDEGILNAVIVVVLVSAILASLAAGVAAPRIPSPPAKVGKLGTTVLVPLADIERGSQSARIASILAASDSGTVVPLTVLDLEATAADVRRLHDELTKRIESLAMANGAEARSVVRLDLTPSAGMLHAAIEHQATCIVMDWRGSTNRRGAVLGDKLDAVVATSPVPVIVCRPGSADPPGRLVLAVDRSDGSPNALPGLFLASAVASRIAERARLKLVLVRTVDPLPSVLEGIEFDEEYVDTKQTVLSMLRDRTDPGDIVVKSLSPFGTGAIGRSPIVRMSSQLGGRTILATVSRAESVGLTAPTGLAPFRSTNS